jgi:hypothetical protein
MKGLLGSGLCVALALLSAQSFAEEIQWRSAVPLLGTPTPAARGAAVTPVAFTVPAATQTTAGVGLGRPMGVGESIQENSESNPPDFRPILNRPLSVFRGQAPDVPVQPLPVGFPLTQDSGKDPKGAAKKAPQSANPPPMPLEPDFVSPMPKVVVRDTVADPYGSSRYSCAAGPDCCGIASMGDCGSGCFQDPCACEEGCLNRGRIWGSASYLGWGFERKNVPPLVTLSPVGTPRGTTGVLGFPTTMTVFDQNNQESLFHSGGRFNFGFWMPRGNWGLEVDYLFLNQNSVNSTFGSNGDPQFSRPVINAVTGLEASQLVSFPGVVTGNVSVNTVSQMWGLEMNARQKLFCGPRFWVDMLYGYRHLDLSEGITISEALNAGGLGITVVDQFNTRNIFNGPQIGIQSEFHFWERFFVGSTLKLAMGNMHEQVNIAGSTGFLPPGGTATVVNGGILALPTNIGIHQSDRFAVLPETNLKLGYEINDHWRVWAGYDFLFVSNVARPGDQIDRRINPTQIPSAAGPQPLVGVPQPAVLFRTTTFYAQGVSAGLQYRW